MESNASFESQEAIEADKLIIILKSRCPFSNLTLSGAARGKFTLPRKIDNATIYFITFEALF